MRWKKRYDGLAEKYEGSIKANDYTDKTSCRAICQLLGRMLSNYRGKRIFDIGCGNGLFSSSFGYEGLVYGMDISYYMLIYAKAKGLECLQGNALEIPIKKNAIDITISSGMVQYLRQKELSICLKELWRVTIRGGLIIVITLNGDSILRKLLSLAGKYVKFNFETAFSVDDVIMQCDALDIEVTEVIFFSPLWIWSRTRKLRMLEKLMCLSFCVVGRKN